MEEVFLNGKKLEPFNEEDAELFEVYIKDEDIKKMQEENIKPF